MTTKIHRAQPQIIFNHDSVYCIGDNEERLQDEWLLSNDLFSFIVERVEQMCIGEWARARKKQIEHTFAPP